MRPFSRAFALFLLCFLVQVARAAPPGAKPKETTNYGVYFQKQRIGAMVSKTFSITHANKPALQVESESSIKLTLLGNTVEQATQMVYVVTPTGKPIQSTMSVTSDGRTTRYDAVYEPTRVVCSVDAGGQKSQKVVPIPKGVTLINDPQLETGLKGAIKIGVKQTVHFFEPLSLTIQSVTTEVLKKEERLIKGKTTPVFLMKSTSPLLGASEAWVDSAGVLLENTHPLGIRIVREDAGAPPSDVVYSPPTDFAIATSVKTEVKIPDARKTGTLKVKISGIPDADLVLTDTRQQVLDRQQADGKWTVTYHIQSRELPAVSMPVAAPGATGPGLGDATYLGTVDPTIRTQATTLAAGETDRALIARRVRAWVKGHMQKPTSVNTPRSAVEIMQSRDGVCRDYATLFTAVARAAGIPTRICTGIVYFKEGFFYHAWVECQLQAGENGWYAFDPTLDTDFVDATHIKFSQGDPTAMFAAIRIVGQIKAEILDYK